jgi:hypothetical protein
MSSVERMRRQGRLWGRLGAWLLIGLATFATALESEAAGTDPKVAVPILLKVITYDRNFAARGEGEFVVLVASEAGQQDVRAEVLTLVKSMRIASIQNRPIKWVSAEFKDRDGLAGQVDQHKASAILAVPGLSSAGLTQLSAVAQAKQVYTLALDPEMAERSLTVGVSAQGGRPQIVINLGASKAINAIFESSVLKLAKVVQ